MSRFRSKQVALHCQFFFLIAILVESSRTVHALFHMARCCSHASISSLTCTLTNVKCSKMTEKIKRKWRERMKCIQSGINFPSSKLSNQSKFYDSRVLHITSLQLTNTAIKTKYNVKTNKHGPYKQEICNRIQSD